MASYQKFEDLPVWQTAAELYEHVELFLENAPKRLTASFRDQLSRAALSVSNNIAEGFERGTTKELIAFIYIARGSSGEVRSMIHLLNRRDWMNSQKAELAEITRLAESGSRQLRAWAESLQNSELTGTRHLNDKERGNYQKAEARKQGQAAFQELLKQHLPQR